jgi:FHS family L-fucose permease-like MFS transporter
MGDVETPRPAAVDSPSLRFFVFALFFIFGGITSLNDVLIPKLKSLFTLSYGEAMLVQSAFFGAYFLISIPAAAIVQRIGYLRTAAIGLITMTAGCLLFAPASLTAGFPMFLLALFVLAAGITIVQVVANPLISRLGPEETAHSRLTFAQAFNSLGTTIFPYVGSIVILGSLAWSPMSRLIGPALDAFRAQETLVVVRAYFALALVLACVAVAVWTQRNRLQDERTVAFNPFRAFSLLARPRFAFGALCIFVYVGAEVAIGSLIVNYLVQADVFGIGVAAAGKHVPFYWGGAMVGRFIGAGVLRVISPGKVLGGAGAVVILLLLTAAESHGAVSGWALLSVGLFNSIMFPTIFSLASEGLGPRAAEGSGLICVAIVGGAVIPPLTGHLADLFNLRIALIAPALCYLVIVAFGLYTQFADAPSQKLLKRTTPTDGHGPG